MKRIVDTLSDADRSGAIEKPKEPGTNFAKQVCVCVCISNVHHSKKAPYVYMPFLYWCKFAIYCYPITDLRIA